ncbi:cyclin T1, putative [Medicago truncatula]|uniref:Cyclin T1, putative n=2 Tax=Medicago truncatula TaxID=3880 RepID=A0A072UCV5_MEDTR|nr:cyclin T1, putative [Medicago truncatula]
MQEVYEQQKELILLGERVLLATLDFYLNVQLPYEPLAEGIIKLNLAKNYALVQAAWSFVDDGLSTSLCLQFKPNHLAASALFLAAKFLKVNLPSDGEKDWWQQYDLTKCQLEEVSYQMLELYEQKRIPPSQASEAERAATKSPATNEEQASKQISFHPSPWYSSSNNSGTDISGSTELGSDITSDDKREVEDRSKSGTDRIVVGDQDRMDGRNLKIKEGSVGHSPKEAVQMTDKVKLKAAFVERRKEQGEVTVKKDVMDDDDCIDRELEDGVEIGLENEKNKQEIRQNWSMPDDVDHGKAYEETRDGRQISMKGQLQKDINEYIAEEGEVIDDDASSLLNNHKRKMDNSPARQPEMKKRLGCSYTTGYREPFSGILFHPLP